MAVTNQSVEIRLGNLECELVGPAPLRSLEGALNPHIPDGGRATRGYRPEYEALVFDVRRQRFLAGALPQVKKVLRREGVRFSIRDCRACPTLHPDRWVLQGHPLRDYQKIVVHEALDRGMGVIDVGTGGGKTLLAAAIVASLGLPTLYLVTTRPLMMQAAGNLRAYLAESGGEGLRIGTIGDGVHAPEEITVALVQALTRPGTELDRWRDGVLVFDEGHHAAAPGNLALLRRIGARYNFFMSAVPFRSGADQAVLDALTGGTLTGRKYSAQYLIDHGYACPADVRVERSPIAETTTEQPFWPLYMRNIVRNRGRNARIAELALAETARGAATLILVDRIEHGEALLSLAPSFVFINGEAPRGRLRDVTLAFRNGENLGLIATSQLFQEGVSIDGIAAILQAGGLKSRNKILQSIGRGLRTMPGKTSVTYIDFLDEDDAGILRQHSLERFAVLREEGFHVPPIADLTPVPREAAPIAPSWFHVEGTRCFLRIDAEGQVVGEQACVNPACVPKRFCERCDHRLECAREGRHDAEELRPGDAPVRSTASARARAQRRQGSLPTLGQGGR